MSDESKKNICIKGGAAKRLALDVILYEDTLKGDGKRTVRTAYPKRHFRGYRELKDKILACIEYGVVDSKEVENLKTTNDSAISWHFAPKGQTFKPERTQTVVAERFTDDPVELSMKEVSALAYFFNEREDLPDVTVEALDEIENLIALVKK